MITTASVLRERGSVRPYEASTPLRVEPVSLDEPGFGEVLIKITAAGVCHSDLSVVNGDRPRPLPMALGHESAAVVQQVGAGVTQVQPGDHVVTVFVPSCGVCSPCREGRSALCESAAAANAAGTLLSGERRLKDVDGAVLHHHLGVSSFAQHAVVSENSLVVIDSNIPPEIAALFGCAVLTGVGAVVNTGRLRAGQSVAVIGLGGVGMAALIGAVAAGGAEVIAVDTSAEKLHLARELGATRTFKADEAAVEQIRDATGGGVDLAVETAGVIPALETAYQGTRRGGTTVTASLPHPSATWPIAPTTLVAEERTLRGSYLGSSVPTRDVPRYLNLWRAGRLPVDRILGEQFALADINVALDRLEQGQALRQVVMMDD